MKDKNYTAELVDAFDAQVQRLKLKQNSKPTTKIHKPKTQK